MSSRQIANFSESVLREDTKLAAGSVCLHIECLIRLSFVAIGYCAHTTSIVLYSFVFLVELMDTAEAHVLA